MSQSTSNKIFRFMTLFGSIFGIALHALTSNKLRSGLTLLGVMIGVTSVMTIMSAIEGMAGSIEKELERMGPSTFIVQRIAIITSDEMYWEKIKRKPLDFDAVDLIEESCDLVEKVSPRAFQSVKLKYKSNSLPNIFLVGAKSNFIDIVDYEVAQGRFHFYEDDIHNRRVVFIGDLVRETFFEGVDPLGKEIKINSVSYTIIGVGKKQGDSFGQSRDNFVIVPISAFTRQFGLPRNGLSIMIKANSVEELPFAMDQTRAVLRAQRHVPFDKEDDFDMVTAESILEILNSITKILRFGLVGISSISLVVGGIVVMNIMMVSVSERTREIGIRKSLGAKRKHILTQFLFESLMITFTGGVVGIVFGYFLASFLVGMIDMEIEPSMLAITAGLTISTGTGLIFGIYPALKAARLDPIKALSYE